MLKPIKSLLLTAFLAMSAQLSFGQALLSTIPTTKQEYIKSEKNVIATVDWLENTPPEKEKEKRDEQLMLLFAWSTSSPTVTIDIDYKILDFVLENPDLLITFMGGWTKYALQNNYSKDKIKCAHAGIKSAIKVYTTHSLKQDEYMEKLIELDNKGELEDWIKKNLEN